jgi:hypothetical protein
MMAPLGAIVAKLVFVVQMLPALQTEGLRNIRDLGEASGTRQAFT